MFVHTQQAQTLALNPPTRLLSLPWIMVPPLSKSSRLAGNDKAQWMAVPSS